MNNAQIIFNESVELMKNGLIGTTGRQITIEYEKDGEKVKETIQEPEPIHTYAEWKKPASRYRKDRKQSHLSQSGCTPTTKRKKKANKKKSQSKKD